MRIRELLLFGLCACSDGVLYPGGTPQHLDVTISDPAPPMQLRIESCRVDIDACMDLCNATARANNIFATVIGCNVSFDASETYVALDYSAFVSGGVP